MGTVTALQVEFRRPSVDLVGAVAEFFERVRGSDDERWFHPHGFTREEAEARCGYAGKDVYCVATLGDQVLAYGMLRGWDQGYEVPSLGILVDASARGTGLGLAMMAYLHAEAKRRGAPRVRLKVYPDNQKAIRLYTGLGYVFSSAPEGGQLVGLKEL